MKTLIDLGSVRDETKGAFALGSNPDSGQVKTIRIRNKTTGAKSVVSTVCVQTEAAAPNAYIDEGTGPQRC